MSINLTSLSTIAGLNGAEINAFDPAANRLFITGEVEDQATGDDRPIIQVYDVSDPTNPVFVQDIDLIDLGLTDLDGGVTSVAVADGLLAAAITGSDEQAPGTVAFFDTATLALTAQVEVGPLPDMVTFTPDGSKVLVANEGEPDGSDPSGSVSIIDVATFTAATAGFEAFNGQEEALRNAGVRIFPGKSTAEDVEPEYIAVSEDGTTAFVTLQEANAFAVVDIATATVEDIVPLGLKDFSQGLPTLTEFEFGADARGLIANDGAPLTTSEGETIDLGGFSGLHYVGEDNGKLKFLTVPDRGPNGDVTDDNERPFLLPDYQARVVEFTLDPGTGAFEITNQILLTRDDGGTSVPITGLPNIPGVDRVPVDAGGNIVDGVIGAPDGVPDFDPFGADLEGIVTQADGTFWMVDEYRPAIYHFNADGTLINRFVPEGTAAQVGEDPGDFGEETLPAEYLNRRANRGFEAVALDEDGGVLYAFIQTPLSNPDRAAGDASNVIRILGIDPSTGTPVSEYVYLLEDPSFRPGGVVDKIGDAVYAGDGRFFVIERDSGLEDTAKKYIFEIDITNATNVLGQDFGAETLEQQTADDLAAAGIAPVSKVKVLNLPSLGYLPSDKPEGLTLLGDGRLAVLNDNDFGLEPGAEAVSLGLIAFDQSNGLDASDEDGGINIQTWPVFGMYMPDAIASFEVGGQTFYVTANEGDARDEDERIGDLALDPDAFPDAAILQQDENLGRLQVSTIDGDVDDDGLFEQLYSYGARSFSIWDAFGNLVFDSGDAIAEITAGLVPDLFNSEGTPDSFDERSDNKGAEPEGVATGVVDGTPYAFIGLERTGGILVYDVSDPTAPSFVQYINTAPGDIAPEGLTFISAEDSPSGTPLLSVSFEESETVTLFAIAETLAIPNIQGAGHLSPLEGEEVTTSGIVTAVAFNGFYLQDPSGDGDVATSDGIFVFTGGSPAVDEGDEVRVMGTVSEFIPGGADTGNLSITQITAPTTTVLSTGNDLPAPTVIGESGRIPPNEIVISDDELPTNLQEVPGVFNPDVDGIDFYESLEGMRVTVEDAQAVSPTRVFSPFSAEAFTVPNQGANATPPLHERGGIYLRSGPDNRGDQNPERVQIQFDPTLLPDGFDTPKITVGDDLGDVTGVVGYSFGNFEINVTEAFTITPSGLTQQVTDLMGSEDQLTVASYNVLNLSPGDTEQLELLGMQIAMNLGAPDILALQEIQDDSGEADDGTVDADQTLQALVDAVLAAGGPAYEFFDVDPEDNTQGGVPGGNIRNAYLYNPGRVDLAGFEALDEAELAALGASNPQAFEGTRTPLFASFDFNGEIVQIINVHNTSRFGSTPVFGGPQPFIQAGEAEREAQARALNDIVDTILGINPTANVIVTGDLNTFEFTNDLTEILPGTGADRVLTNLVDQAIADGDAYTFIFDGNSQVLDHMFVSDSLLPASFDIVHVNNDFPRDDDGDRFDDTIVASDHEPIVGRFTLEGDPDLGDVIVGTDDDDRIRGTTGNDRVVGRDGDDVIDGRTGDDILASLRGNNEINGGPGNDVITTGAGDDTLDGGTGDDIIQAGAGNDVIDGGTGDDILDGGAGEDEIEGGTGADILVGGLGNDLLEGGTGGDLFVLAAGAGTDTIVDFQVGEDLVGLSSGLAVDMLSWGSAGGHTTITADAEVLAVLHDVDDLSASDFLMA